MKEIKGICCDSNGCRNVINIKMLWQMKNIMKAVFRHLS